MAAGNMLRLIQSFSALNTHTTAWSICQRGISNKSLLEKLGLPEKPKKPPTPFFTFLESMRPEIKRKNPGASATEITQMSSKLWKQVDDKEKERMSEEFKKELKKYKVELEKYEKSLSAEQKAEIREAEADIKALKDQKLMKLIKHKREKQLQKPKRPVTPFLKFALENFTENDVFKDHMKIMSERWTKLSDSTKQKYTNEFLKEKEKFFKDLELWEEEMIKQGNVDVVRSKTLKQKLKVYS